MEDSESHAANGYNPNHIPRNERKWNIIFSLILILIGTIALAVDDLFIPSSNRRIGGVHFHGKTIWVFFCAFLCASANMISVVVDHYDKRNNEINYRQFARVTEAIGWAFLFAAFFLEAIVFQKAKIY